MNSRRLPDAVCVVVLRDNAVLAVSRRTDHSAYGLPGGGVEPGETPEGAAARELEEETGLVVALEDLKPVHEDTEPVSKKLVRTYLASDPGGATRRSEEGIVVWVGWPALLTGPFAAYNAAVRHALVELPEQWAAAWGSGTLRRAIEEKMAWRELYLHERTAFEFGYGFEAATRSRLTTGRPLSEGDSPATTETCWWARALRWRSERDRRPAEVRVVHARLDDGSAGAREGIAITYEPAVRPAWLPPDRVLVAFTLSADGKGTVNPC